MDEKTNGSLTIYCRKELVAKYQKELEAKRTK